MVAENEEQPGQTSAKLFTVGFEFKTLSIRCNGSTAPRPLTCGLVNHRNRQNMQPFEIAFLLVTALVLAALSRRAGRWPGWTLVLSLAAALLAVIQVWTEGYRWQMIPGYVLTGGLLVLAGLSLIWSISVPRPALWPGWVLLAGAFGAGTVFPMFQFPNPTGPYAVGTEIRQLVDWNRKETLGGVPGRPRELMIQIWYPAKVPSEAKPMHYIPDERLVRSWRDSHLTSVRTHSFLNAPVAPAAPPFPVVIFSPSWQGERNQNTFQVEELASHGFVVVGIDHTYSTSVTLFPDGRVVRTPPMAFRDLSSEEALRGSFQLSEKLIHIRARDIEFVAGKLNHLGSAGSPDLLDGRLDLDRAGVFGFSFGGGAAAQACWMDKHFKAGIDMAGAMFGEAATSGIEQPFLFFDEGDDVPWADFKSSNPVKRRYAGAEKRDFDVENNALEKHGGYRVRILGTEHINFTDTALFSPVRYLSGAGRIDPRRAMHVINAYTLAFFEKYLNGEREPLLEGPSPEFPEVRFQRMPMPSAGQTVESSVRAAASK